MPDGPDRPGAAGTESALAARRWSRGHTPVRGTAEPALHDAAEADLLVDLGGILLGGRELQPALDAAAAAVAAHFGAARCTWLEIDADEWADVLVDRRLDGGRPVHAPIPTAELGVMAWNVAEQPLAAADPETDAADAPDVLHLPLVDGEGSRLLLVLAPRQPRAWSESDLATLRRVNRLVWSRVIRARRDAEFVRLHAAMERRLHERTRALASANDALRDQVADRRAAERQIKHLFRRLVTSQENERSRIARDIHDQLGQQITALRMHLEALAAGAAAASTLRPAIERTQRLAEELDATVDALTWDLRPAALDHLGLTAALQQLVAGWSERVGIAASFEASGLDRLRFPPEREANLYRLTQEALHNVYKHARAHHAAVSLGRGTDRAVLVIEDDGCGFEAGAADAAGGLGLASMRERAMLAGGHLEVESAPGRGTSVIVTVPIGTGRLFR